MAKPTLYFFCGKMGAGKSTHSAKLAAEKNALLISEDEWLAKLYPGEIKTVADYVEYSSRMKPLVFDLVKDLLGKGIDVVMDFPANTVKQREWFVTLANAANADARLIYLQASDELCLAQIAKRRIEQPQRAAFDNETLFKEVNKYFQEPQQGEQLEITRITAGG